MLANIDDYVPSSVEGLADKLADAQNVLDNAASQAEIDEATKSLRGARLNARTKADTSALEELIAYINSLDLRAYTTESAQTVIQELGRAENLLNDPEATQEAVDDMTKTLQEAVDALDPAEGGQASADQTGTSAAVQTAAFGGMMIIAAAALIIARRRKQMK